MQRMKEQKKRNEQTNGKKNVYVQKKRSGMYSIIIIGIYSQLLAASPLTISETIEGANLTLNKLRQPLLYLQPIVFNNIVRLFKSSKREHSKNRMPTNDYCYALI